METEGERSKPSPSSLSTLSANACPSVKDEGSGDEYLLQVSTVADQDRTGRQRGMSLCWGVVHCSRAQMASELSRSHRGVQSSGVLTRNELAHKER